MSGGLERFLSWWRNFVSGGSQVPNASEDYIRRSISEVEGLLPQSEEAPAKPPSPLFDFRHTVISGHGNIFAHTVTIQAPRPPAIASSGTRRRPVSRR